MLKNFGDEIWIADGPTTSVAGFHYPTRMAIIRLSGGNLLVWSPIALSQDLQAQVDALGAVRYLVPPNSLHHLFLGDWQHAYPGASVYAPPGLRTKRKDIRFDFDLGEAPIPAWADDLDHVLVPGNLITTEVVFFHRPSRTTLFTDLIQHFDAAWFDGWRAVVAKLDLMVAPEPSVPRKFRMAFVNRPAAREAVKRILAWPTAKVLMAHGEPITGDGQAFLARAFAWLIK
ncbi:hypothetical protein BA190_11240 [Labrys sp. WJW]|uniref:DUF4336 domain-containing protein n=1 Tax=Labrys sp. WJW TaxID=1737983 RepID=UPI00082DE48A|nr:DUF4336 domain-containing protein [Labrys sp. WJW]OCC04959.1 hypothetical protein BA190_11240 [Labrys sp. WJW]